MEPDVELKAKLDRINTLLSDAVTFANHHNLAVGSDRYALGRLTFEDWHNAEKEDEHYYPYGGWQSSGICGGEM